MCVGEGVRALSYLFFLLELYLVQNQLISALSSSWKIANQLEIPPALKAWGEYDSNNGGFLIYAFSTAASNNANAILADKIEKLEKDAKLHPLKKVFGVKAK
jgi:hypothetical protein